MVSQLYLHLYFGHTIVLIFCHKWHFRSSRSPSSWIKNQDATSIWNGLNYTQWSSLGRWYTWNIKKKKFILRKNTYMK